MLMKVIYIHFKFLFNLMEMLKAILKICNELNICYCLKIFFLSLSFSLNRLKSKMFFIIILHDKVLLRLLNSYLEHIRLIYHIWHN